MDYFKQPGQSSGNLSTAHNAGEWCPDMVLEMERLEKEKLFWTYAFEMGHAFEALIQDMATGSDTFYGKFFRSNVQSAPIMDAKSTAHKIAWTQKYFHQVADYGLKSMMKINKDGTPRKGSESRNEIVDECRAHPNGELPVTKDDYAALSELAEKTLSMPIPEFWGAGPNIKLVGDFLCHSLCQFQEEIYWTRGGILKKAKTDCLIVHGGGAAIIDLKWTSLLSNFESRLKKKYWIQAQHYEEAVFEKYGLPLPMLFVVAAQGDKNTPPMPTAMMVSDMECSGRDWCSCRSCRLAKYEWICRKYYEWEKSGRGALGYLPAKKVKVWA
jgi:hypothetical protein